MGKNKFLFVSLVKAYRQTSNLHYFDCIFFLRPWDSRCKLLKAPKVHEDLFVSLEISTYLCTLWLNIHALVDQDQEDIIRLPRVSHL